MMINTTKKQTDIEKECKSGIEEPGTIQLSIKLKLKTMITKIKLGNVGLDSLLFVSLHIG